jgi:hypothetical protein
MLLALAADALVIAVFLYVALGAGSSPGAPALGQEGAEPAEAPPTSGPALPVVSAPSAGKVKVEIEDIVGATGIEAGVAVVGKDGELLLGANEEQPFVLASVAKVYILAAYLDQLEGAALSLDDNDVALLDAMIRYSDNDSATTLWNAVGGEEGIVAFLESRGLPPVRPVEDDAWGTLSAPASEVADLFWRLVYGRLLGPESTEVARELLSDIDPDQSWGVSAGAGLAEEDVLLKNGWYPETEGWRINSAGAVEDTGGGYVMVVLTYRSDTLREGIGLVELIASRINGLMGSD